MKLEKIKDTATWKHLSINAKFEKEFDRIIKNCSYHVELGKLDIDVSDKSIKISYNSEIKNRDLDSQLKIFNSILFSIDDDNSLVISESSGKLESNYGYDFSSTVGGKLITNYSTILYDDSGIELFYQSYGDKYILSEDEFKKHNKHLEKAVMETYNPNLSLASNDYPHPEVIGSYGRFLRRIRVKNNLGIVEVSKCHFDKEKTPSNFDLEYYFNTFLGTNANSPELIHIMNGFPFATIDSTHRLKFNDDYAKLGLTVKNYEDVARERFLRELLAEREKHFEKGDRILHKYDMMIEKVKNELGVNKKSR